MTLKCSYDRILFALDLDKIFYYFLLEVGSLTSTFDLRLPFGGVPKRLKGAVLKTARRVTPVRGFESHPLRQWNYLHIDIYLKKVYTMVCVAERWPSRLKALAC
ncbi:MAG: hypothetical protein PWQ96_1 [Clostridia bacterium]|nr:hypothetical protein [Clostridia bacterium]